MRPFFSGDQIVEQQAVALSSPGIVRENDTLRDRERQLLGHSPLEGHQDLSSRPEFRPQKRHGAYLANDPYGLLVTDMTSGRISRSLSLCSEAKSIIGPSRAQVIEFKPKWLVQSPNAPKDSKRCRQCAREARSNAELARSRGPLRHSFCPFDLVSKAPEDRFRASREIIEPEFLFTPNSPRLSAPPLGKVERLRKVDHFTTWLGNNTLLPRLQELQISLDRKGILKADSNDETFLVAMTLRDCTVFLRYDGVDGVIEARIGDLDVKSPRKAEYWKEIERALIDEGWYLGTEKEEDTQPLTCSLSRGHGESMEDWVVEAQKTP